MPFFKDKIIDPLPKYFAEVMKASKEIDFPMPSDLHTGALLRTLAVAKPHSRFLELGTGTGLGACWLLEGMDNFSTLTSVENEPKWLNLAKELITDSRVKFIESDGLKFLEEEASETYDFVFADTWPGKYVGFEHSLRILNPGGIIVFDDMLPQPNWPKDHPPKVERFIKEIANLSPSQFKYVNMCWYTGHIILAKH